MGAFKQHQHWICWCREGESNPNSSFGPADFKSGHPVCQPTHFLSVTATCDLLPVRPVRSLAYELVIGTAERFHNGKQIASYVGLVPTEESSGDRRRLGHISKQGNSLLRFLLVEAAQVTVRSQAQWRSTFFHLALRRGRKIAKVAMARKLAVHLYWMWRQGWDYEQFQKLGSHAGAPGNPHGVQ